MAFLLLPYEQSTGETNDCVNLEHTIRFHTSTHSMSPAIPHKISVDEKPKIQ